MTEEQRAAGDGLLESPLPSSTGLQVSHLYLIVCLLINPLKDNKFALLLNCTPIG